MSRYNYDHDYLYEIISHATAAAAAAFSECDFILNVDPYVRDIY